MNCVRCNADLKSNPSGASVRFRIQDNIWGELASEHVLIKDGPNTLRLSEICHGCQTRLTSSTTSPKSKPDFPSLFDQIFRRSFL